jgi:hypothetical protein
MKAYRSLFKLFKDQPPETAFAHFYPTVDPQSGDRDYDQPFKRIATSTLDGYDSWGFQQPRFKAKYRSSEVPKLRNYLNYTFVRLLELENFAPGGGYFQESADGEWIAFNTGLQTPHQNDLLAIFQRYQRREGIPDRPVPDWVFKGCYAPNDRQYRERFGNVIPELAWYSADSRDYVFDVKYRLDRDVFDHLFDRAKERAGMPNASDEVVRNYLRGALENLVPKIRRNYKVAIPVYYVEEKRMQLLLPFLPADGTDAMSCFLVERHDEDQTYRLKTIFDLDQAYFSARLITRPDKDWLNP